jgi:hypothetical protein
VVIDLRARDHWRGGRCGRNPCAALQLRKGRPLKPGKAPIVKRTQGWKDNLRERVEDEIEDYDSQEENIEAGKFITWTK